MEETGCEIICGAQAILAVIEQMRWPKHGPYKNTDRKHWLIVNTDPFFLDDYRPVKREGHTRAKHDPSYHTSKQVNACFDIMSETRYFMFAGNWEEMEVERTGKANQNGRLLVEGEEYLQRCTITYLERTSDSSG